jgi:hypothetical protein
MSLRAPSVAITTSRKGAILIITLTSPKRGQGVTVTTAVIAAIIAKHGRDVHIIDRGADQQWLWTNGTSTTDDGITSLTANITMCCTDDNDIDVVRATITAAIGRSAIVLIDDPDNTVWDEDPDGLGLWLDSRRERFGPYLVWWVLRPCFLAFRRASCLSRPDHLIVIHEPGRSIGTSDICQSLGVDLDNTTTIEVDAAVARTVDAGLIASHQPRSMLPVSHLVNQLLAKMPVR